MRSNALWTLVLVSLPLGAHANLLTNGSFESAAFTDSWIQTGGVTRSADLMTTSETASVNLLANSSLAQSFTASPNEVFDFYVRPISLGIGDSSRIHFTSTTGTDLVTLRFTSRGALQIYSAGNWNDVNGAGVGTFTLGWTSHVCVVLNHADQANRSVDIMWSDRTTSVPSGDLALSHDAGTLTSFANNSFGESVAQIKFEGGANSSFRLDHVNAVPEPGTWAALGLGLVALRKRRTK